MTYNTLIPEFTIDFINYHSSPLEYDSYEILDNNRLRIYLIFPDDDGYTETFDTDYPFDHDIFISDFMEYLDDSN